MKASQLTASKRSSMTGLASAVLMMTWVASAAAQERVTWTDQVNVAVRGNSLEKTRGCDGCGDAGATSRQTIDRRNGFVEFRVGEDWTYWLGGLSMRTRGTRFEDIEHGIRFNGNGWADIVENGRYMGGDTEYRAGDVFRIEVVNDRVRYLKDGAVIAVSKKRPTYPLALDVSLGTVGATVANARMGAGAPEVAFDDPNEFNAPSEFDGLDRNGDGLISRREWAGNRRAFDDRDVNRDGLLTRRELEIDEPDQREAIGTAGDFITVSAIDRWTDTGITVRAGDQLTFEADGTIQMSGNRNDSAGPAGARRTAPGALVREAPAGTLIARIGNSEPFAVGARRTIARAPLNGRLFLSVNDDYLGDNSGEYQVMVNVDRR